MIYKTITPTRIDKNENVFPGRMALYSIADEAVPYGFHHKVHFFSVVYYFLNNALLIFRKYINIRGTDATFFLP